MDAWSQIENHAVPIRARMIIRRPIQDIQLEAAFVSARDYFHRYRPVRRFAQRVIAALNHHRWLQILASWKKQADGGQDDELEFHG